MLCECRYLKVLHRRESEAFCAYITHEQFFFHNQINSENIINLFHASEFLNAPHYSHLYLIHSNIFHRHTHSAALYIKKKICSICIYLKFVDFSKQFTHAKWKSVPSKFWSIHLSRRRFISGLKRFSKFSGLL